MKANLYTQDGKTSTQIDLPAIFSTPIREDIIAKFFELSKERQPYAPYAEAGRRHSASGTISHQRHDWKGHYGKGISRIPRKTMNRHGTQFFWIGAEISSTRGGRRAHPPKLNGAERKINKKEAAMAINAAFAATANKNYVISRYATLKQIDSVPFIIESLPKKTKDLLLTLKSAFGEQFSLVIKRKVVRAGRGKTRGRRFKSNAGALIVISSDENAKFKGFDVKTVKDVSIADLYPLGRLTLYTKQALKEMENKK